VGGIEMVLGRVNADEWHSPPMKFFEERNEPVRVFIIDCNWLLQF